MFLEGFHDPLIKFGLHRIFFSYLFVHWISHGYARRYTSTSMMLAPLPQCFISKTCYMHSLRNAITLLGTI
jgi:hypothetical protein